MLLPVVLCRSQPIKAIIPHDVPQFVFNTRYYGEQRLVGRRSTASAAATPRCACAPAVLHCDMSAIRRLSFCATTCLLSTVNRLRNSIHSVCPCVAAVRDYRRNNKYTMRTVDRAPLDIEKVGPVLTVGRSSVPQ
jgi:hypothetical protein